MIYKFKRSTIVSELFKERQRIMISLHLSPPSMAMENGDVKIILGFESWHISNVVHWLLQSLKNSPKETVVTERRRYQLPSRRPGISSHDMGMIKPAFFLKYSSAFIHIQRQQKQNHLYSHCYKSVKWRASLFQNSEKIKQTTDGKVCVNHGVLHKQ